MKNFNLIERLWTDSHEKQSATRDHHGTKSRELPGNPRPLRYLCATIALPLRYAAMIALLLTLVCGNVWGATDAPSGLRTQSSLSYASTDTIQLGGKVYEVFWCHNNSANVKTSVIKKQHNGSNTEAIGSDKFCVVGSSVGTTTASATGNTIDEFTWSGASSPRYWRVRHTNAANYQIVIVVKGYDGVAALHKANTDLLINVERYNTATSSYVAYSPKTTSVSSATSSHYKTYASLDANEQFKITFLGTGTSGSTNRDMMAFSLCYTPAASTYTVSASVNPAGYGSVSPTSLTGIASGTSVSTSSNVLTVGSSTITATATTAADYTYSFSNWTKSDGTALPSTVTAALAVRANFSRAGKSYTITLDKDGGSGGSATVSATYGSAMPSAGAAPTQDGYTFLGYYTSKVGVGTQYYDATPASVKNSDFTSTATLYAGWKVNAPSISFSEDLSNMVTITGTAGASIYYTTDGSTPSESSTLYSAPFTINADKTIKAIAIKAGAQNSAVASLSCTYSAPPTWYTLSYDANGGTGSMPSHDFTSGTTVYAGQNTSFTPPSGKIFKCWNTAPNGGGTSYSEGASFTLSGNTTLYAQWITASTGSTYCINMYNLSVSDQMKYFTHSGYNDMYILDLEVPSYNTGGNNFWVGKNGSWYNDGLGNSNAKSANEKLEDLCLKGNRSTKLGTASQGVLARFFVYDNSANNNLYIEFTPKQYSLIWGSGGDWSPVKLYPSGYQNEWTSEVVTLTSDQISSYNYYVGILKADDGVAYWYKSNTLSVGSMGTYNKRTDTWGGNVSTLSAGDKGFFRMWSDATSYDNWRCHFVPVYTLSYNANSGSGAPSAVYIPSEGDDSHRTVYVSATEPTRTGYNFIGWATSSGRAASGTVDYVAGTAITISANTELFAVWTCIVPDAPTAAKITVTPSCAGTGATFSANTSGLPSYVTWYWQTAADGTSTSYPASSDYTTSTSAGTYTMYLRAKNTACGEWSNSASTPSKSVKVKTPVTISWNTAPADGYEGGSMTASVTTNYAAGVTYAVTAASPAGCVTINETSGAISYVAEGTATITATVTGAGADYCSTANVSQSISVAANKYTVTYAANGGSGSVPTDANYYDPDDEVTVLGKNTLSMSGYTFCGWSYNGYVYVEGDKFNITESATLTAVWNQNATTVTLTHFGKQFKTSDPRRGYAYVGSTSGTKYIIESNSSDVKNSDGDSSAIVLPYSNKFLKVLGPGSTTSITDSLFSNVTQISFKWKYVASTTTYTTGIDVFVGSTKVETKSLTGNKNDSYATATVSNIASLSGAVKFVNTGTSSSNQKFWLDDIAITYSASTYKKVTFNKGSGPSTVSGLPPVRYVPSGSKIAEPSTDPTAAGYIFGGWYTDSGCTSAWDWGSSTVSKDTTLYAKWTAKSTPTEYTVTIDVATVCSGSSTNIKMASSQSGVSYQLYKGEDKVGDAKAGGSALTWSSISATGTYKVMAVENATYAAREMSNTVSLANYDAVSIKTHPTEEIAATVDAGSDMSVVLNTGTFNNATYTWQTCTDATPSSASDISSGSQYANYNTATMTFTPAAEGTYYFRCKVTDDCGTTAYSNVATVTASDLNDITMGTHTNGSFTIKVGSADAVSTSTAASAGTTIAIVATPSSGYAFKNWEILDGSDDDITTTVGASATSASTSFTMPSEAVTINAVFVATHTLTVSVSGGVGGSVSPTSTTVGETLTQSITATPSTGYNFSSWAVSGTGASLSSTTTNPTTFTMGAANATVTATFSAKTYSIELNAGNGTGGSESVTMTYNSASHTSITAPTLTGYSLVGWYTGAGGTGTMIMNASGTLQASVAGYTDGSGNWTKDATCTLYAKYTANYPSGYLYITDVMATPEAKAGYTITMTKNSANYNGTLGSTLQTNRAGYEYWADATGSSGNITLSFSDALPASATAGGLIIDVWWGADSNNRTTSIALNGGSAELLDAANTSTGDRDIVKKATYATELKSLSSITLSCNGGHTVWFRIGIKNRPGYLLTYDDGDGSGAPSAEYKPNATITLSETVPTRSGYMFDGWQVGGSGTIYQPGGEFSMPASAVTLVAKWTAIDFEFKAGTTKGSEPTDGTVITSSNLSTYWTAGAVLTGGTMTNTSGATLGINASYGFVYAANGNRQLTINLTGSKALGAGTEITVYGYSNNSTDACGFKISGNNMSPATYTPASAACTAFTQTYTVTEGSALDGETSFTVDPANTIRVYLNRIIVTGCQSCTPIDPELTAGTTTLYLEPTITSTTLTLDKDGSTGSVDWSVSPSGVVSITGSGTEVTITAVAAGSATVKATIGSDGTHCGKTVTKDFTVATCEIMEIAGATVASATSGILTGTTAIVTGLSSNKLNTNGTSMFGLILPSSANHFQVGDSILFNLKVGDWYQGAKVSSMCVYVSAGKAASKLNIYTSASIASGTSTTIRFAVTQAMIDAGLVDSVIVFRDATTTQNHVMSSVSVKRYACSDGLAKFTGDGADANWSTADNWANGKVPTIDDRAIVEQPIVVNIAHAVAKEVILYQNSTNTGSLSIQANKGLELVGKVQVWDGSTLSATGEADLVLESSSAGNASLIFDNSNSCQATVQMYSKATIVGNTWNWQYVGTPFTGSIPQYNYYGSWMYKWDGGWQVVKGYDELTPFVGYCLTQNNATTHVMGGTLVPTTSKSVDMAASTDMVLANSWTAPISIASFDIEGGDATFTSTPATIYLFNTGMAEEGSEVGTEAGTYISVPINSAPYTGNGLIAPMQGFFVTTNGGSAGTITMNYNDLVRPAGNHTDIVAGPMKAPRRAKAAEVKPDVMKIKANGEVYNDRVVILAREDFSDNFDNGWDGEKLSFGEEAPSVYVINGQGGYDAVSAIPSYEGTVVGFRAGTNSSCTMSFEYDGEETLYLNDLQAQQSTLIDAAQTYTFITSGSDDEARFIISATPIHQTATGVDGAVQSTDVRKVIIDNQMYIIRGGRMYDATGQMVK